MNDSRGHHPFLTKVGVAVVAKVASVGVAVVAKVAVAVSNGSGHVGNNGVVGDLVGDEGAVVGVRSGDAGVVVSIGVSLGISLSDDLLQNMVVDKKYF